MSELTSSDEQARSTTSSEEPAAPADYLEEIVQHLMGTPTPEDPYPHYAALRREAPVYRSPSLGMTFLTRYDDCRAALRSESLQMVGAGLIAASDPRYEASAWLQAIQHMLVFTNPPKHTRMRGVLQKAFTPRVVSDLRPRIEGLVDQHIARVSSGGSFDLVGELAAVLPSQVICELLGVPVEDHARVRSWSDDIAATVQPVVSDEVLARADQTIEEFRAYMFDLVEQCRAQPADDLVSRMIRAADEEGLLEADELVNFAISLLAAGTETTTNLIAVGVLLMLRNPDQLALLRADPSLMGGAVEELLRLESPVQMAFARSPQSDVELPSGDRLTAGEIVAVLLGAANHDPSVFPDPERLDITRRSERPPMAFGFGPHFCIGAPLARLEGEVVLRRLLLDRERGIALVDGNPPWRAAFTLRGVERLQVAL